MPDSFVPGDLSRSSWASGGSPEEPADGSVAITSADGASETLQGASIEGVRRTLALARRALRARNVALVDTAVVFAGEQDDAILTAAVTPGGTPVAALIVRDDASRSWSDDERAMLKDLADSLAFEMHLTERLSRAEDLRNADAAPAHAGVSDEDSTVLAPVGTPPQPDVFHILLADDLDLNRKLICDMLALDGYEVDSVADGAAAVEAAQAKAYDLILMDMIMPGMDGMDATRAIRALPAPTCDVPIVALTAHSFREQLDSCIQAGMNATLTKPMSFDALSSVVGTWARSRRQAA